MKTEESRSGHILQHMFVHPVGRNDEEPLGSSVTLRSITSSPLLESLISFSWLALDLSSGAEG